MFWNPTFVYITSLYVHEQAITCEIEVDQGKKRWIQSFIYGSTRGLDRKALWQHLGFIKMQIAFVSWLIGALLVNTFLFFSHVGVLMNSDGVTLEHHIETLC